MIRLNFECISIIEEMMLINFVLLAILDRILEVRIKNRLEHSHVNECQFIGQPTLHNHEICPMGEKIQIQDLFN